MDKDTKRFMDWVDALAKGIIMGCCLGAFAAWLDLIPMAKGVALGGLAGCLASVQFKNMQDDKKAKKAIEKAQEDNK